MNRFDNATLKMSVHVMSRRRGCGCMRRKLRRRWSRRVGKGGGRRRDRVNLMRRNHTRWGIGGVKNVAKIWGDVRIREKIIGGRIDWGDRTVRKNGFIKCDMSRDDDLSGREIKTTESPMVSGVAKKNTRSGTRLEFMCCENTREA